MANSDNFKHHKQRAPRYLSTDGIIPPSHLKKPGSIDFGRSKKPSGQLATLDNFNRPEGFHSGYQPVISGSTGEKLPPGDDPRPLSPVANKAEPKTPTKEKPHRLRKVLLRSGASVIIGVLLIGGFLLTKGYLKARKIFHGGAVGAAALQDSVDPTQLKTEGDGRINVLILGKSGPGQDGPDLTDTMLVASIDPVQKEIGIMSVPRDLYVKVPRDGTEKINAVYANEKYAILNSGHQTSALQQEAEQQGLNKVQTIVSQVLGIPIHYHVMIDYHAFTQAVDTVGGVTVNVQQQLYDPTVAWQNHNNPLIAPVGIQTMNGAKALLYARSRHGSARADFDRTERQRQIILALKDKILSGSTYSNPIKISQLLDAFGNHIETDLSINEVTKLYDLAKNIPGNKIYSIGLADPPNNFVTTADMAGQAVVIPSAGLYNYSEMQNYIRNNLRDSFLRKENARVVVLNGTSTPGLATQQATVLRSLGYDVSYVGDTLSKYSQTMLVDLHGNQKYTKHYLEQRFHVVASGSMPDNTISSYSGDFVIILGANDSTNQ